MMDMDSLNNFMDSTILPSMGITESTEGYSNIKSQMTNLVANIILYIKEYGEVSIDTALVHDKVGKGNSEDGNNIGNIIGSVYCPVPLNIK